MPITSPFRLKFLKFLIFWRTCRDSNPKSQRPKRRALSNWATGPQLFYIGEYVMNRYEKIIIFEKPQDSEVDYEAQDKKNFFNLYQYLQYT